MAQLFKIAMLRTDLIILTRKYDVVVVNVLISTTIFLNHFAEGDKSTPTSLLESRTENIYDKSIDTFRFIALTKSVILYKILEVILKDTAYWEESFPSKN